MAGAGLVLLAVMWAVEPPLPAWAVGTGGSWEVATLEAGEVRLETEEAVKAPLPEIVISQRYWLLHSGIDLRAATGTPVRAIMAGRVKTVSQERWGYGKHVIVDHENDYESLYAHLSKIEVVEGQEVTTASVLGEVGSTGRSTGPHLHLEVRGEGRLLNPASFLEI